MILRCSLALVVVNTVVSATFAIADDLPDLSAVIARSSEVLSPPVRYRVRIKGVETTVYKKKLSTGEIATRTDPVPDSQTIVVAINDHFYEILRDSHVVIDKSGVVTQNKQFYRNNEMSLCFIPDLPKGAVASSQTMTLVTRNNKEYLQIKSDLQSEVLKHSKSFPSALRQAVPARQSLLVDRETYVPTELETFSESGDSIVKYEFFDVDQLAVMSDELFALPVEFALKKPVSTTEYFAIHRELWSDIRPQPKFRPVFPKLIEPPPPKKVKFHPEARVFVPDGMTVEQAKADAEVKMQEMLDSRKPSLPKPRDYTRIFILSNVALVLAVVIFITLRRYRRPTPAA